MPADQLRYVEKFTGSGIEVVFPLKGYEYEPSQGFRFADRPVIGADYPYDFNGVHPWAKDVGIEPVRFLLAGDTPVNLQAQYDALLSALRNAGQGQLWTIDAAGVRRWAWAKLASRPGFMSSVEAWQHTPVTLSMRRYSDWMADTQTSFSIDVTGNPQIDVHSYVGNAPAEHMVIVFQPLVAAGFNVPQIENMDNGYITGSGRLSSNLNQRFRIDTERYLAEWSTDGGATYVADYTNLIRGPKQVGFMRLEPGTNGLRFTNSGAANYRVTFTYYPAFH